MWCLGGDVKLQSDSLHMIKSITYLWHVTIQCTCDNTIYTQECTT